MAVKPITKEELAALEEMMRTALSIGDEKLAVDYLIKVGFGSALTCGIAVGRAMGYEGDIKGDPEDITKLT